MKKFFEDWKIHALAFVLTIAAELIGTRRFDLGFTAFSLFPMLYVLIFGGILGGVKVLPKKMMEEASPYIGISVLLLTAKVGSTIGPNLANVIKAGPALLLQEFGNLGTIVLAMPLALLLGLKRESIGAAHSINRETNLALIQDMYGADSPEGQGSLSVYITGGMVGTIYFGFMASMVAATGLFHPYALGMASGVGAGIMMSSAVAALSEVMPEFASEISAMASASETISGIDGIYMAIFIGLPLCNWLYNKLEPTLGRVTKAGREAAERIGK